MFPLPLLPTIQDNLDKMSPRHALQYQNTFMKNALIRGLNVVYHAAHLAVLKMLDLHLEGDGVFLKGLASKCKDFKWASNRTAASFHDAIKSLEDMICGWKKDNRSYRHLRLVNSVETMEKSIVETLHKRASNFEPSALPKGISDDELEALIQENMVWLGTRSDIAILLPFCVSHHDPGTSKFWPPITSDAVEAMPELVKAHIKLWEFAPFDPVTRESKTLGL